MNTVFVVTAVTAAVAASERHCAASRATPSQPGRTDSKRFKKIYKYQGYKDRLPAPANTHKLHKYTHYNRDEAASIIICSISVATDR